MINISPFYSSIYFIQINGDITRLSHTSLFFKLHTCGDIFILLTSATELVNVKHGTQIVKFICHNVIYILHSDVDEAEKSFWARRLVSGNRNRAVVLHSVNWRLLVVAAHCSYGNHYTCTNKRSQTNATMD